MFIPIGIIVNLSEKIDEITENEVPLEEVLVFYGNFTIYFANLLFPIFLFLSIIWFTSKLANNTEIIAILSSGISFWRFLRPYIIGATLVCGIALIFTMYLVPNASQGFNEFKYQYFKRGKQSQETQNVYRQVNDEEFIFATNFQPSTRTARNFTLEHFENNEMKFKISASRLKFNPEDSIYTLSNFEKRIIKDREDVILRKSSIDTVLPFEFDELTPVEYIAETLDYRELKEFIEIEKRRGSANISSYQIVAYKRWSVPVSAFILTIIAVSVSAMKRRGGMGANLAIGIVIAFGYIFLDKVFGTIAEKSTFSPLLAVWLSNILFGILAIYLLIKSKR
ncbi:LptF/LptG family permease [Psychroflexus lacisalsi]|jgi:lipopolysaccharide export system permease protein|uniref:LptF/LptG family permease n=2 Tax=Psychroflexus lacisalsi TaxID=503928 RepID=A0ABP3VMD3_9FLAO